MNPFVAPAIIMWVFIIIWIVQYPRELGDSLLFRDTKFWSITYWLYIILACIFLPLAFQ